MADNNLILAGDIGGTKTHLALVSVDGEKLRFESERTFPSKEYPGLEPVLHEFLTHGVNKISTACFGVAGPVVEGSVKTPNLPWIIDALELKNQLNLPSVALLNDLEAAAFGIFTLEADEFICLNEGSARRPANKALIAAGTGLGEALLYDDGRNYHPIASEGGHGDFAARNDIEIELLRHLTRKFGRVSYERVVSGPGIADIYEFLRDSGQYDEPRSFQEKLATGGDRSALISQAALAGEPEICVKALDVFVSAYGAEAGNLALRGKAIGGVYIGGGIAPKIQNKLVEGLFMRAFVAKGRYKEFVSAIPVYLITNEKTALQGAAYYGAFRSNG
ncbi:MAG TPA: glucokinase [Candidatus Binatia bacterium]|nr:glucokinase [Candidatus Binatia bacterium]